MLKVLRTQKMSCKVCKNFSNGIKLHTKLLFRVLLSQQQLKTCLNLIVPWETHMIVMLEHWPGTYYSLDDCIIHCRPKLLYIIIVILEPFVVLAEFTL